MRYEVKPGGPFREEGTFGVFDTVTRSWPAVVGTRKITQGGPEAKAKADAAWLERQHKAGRS